MFHYPSSNLYFAFDKNIHMFNNFFLISNTHWVRKYAFNYIMNIIDMTKNVLLKQFTYPNMICIPFP